MSKRSTKELLDLRTSIAKQISDVYLAKIPKDLTSDELFEINLGLIWKFTVAGMMAHNDARQIRATVDEGIRKAIEFQGAMDRGAK